MSTQPSANSQDSTYAIPQRWSLRRLMAPTAVGLSLLSAFLTFVVLTGLTAIVPTPEVVRTLLLVNLATTQMPVASTMLFGLTESSEPDSRRASKMVSPDCRVRNWSEPFPARRISREINRA